MQSTQGLTPSQEEIPRLMAWLNYAFACYHALLRNYHALVGNYQQLQAENVMLQKRLAESEQRVLQCEVHARNLFDDTEMKLASANQINLELSTQVKFIKDERDRWIERYRIIDDANQGILDNMSKTMSENSDLIEKMKDLKRIRKYAESPDSSRGDMRNLIHAVRNAIKESIKCPLSHDVLKNALIVSSTNGATAPIVLSEDSYQRLMSKCSGIFPMTRGEPVKSAVRCPQIDRMVGLFDEIKKLLPKKSENQPVEPVESDL